MVGGAGASSDKMLLENMINDVYLGQVRLSRVRKWVRIGPRRNRALPQGLEIGTNTPYNYFQ